MTSHEINEYIILHIVLIQSTEAKQRIAETVTTQRQFHIHFQSSKFKCGNYVRTIVVFLFRFRQISAPDQRFAR